MLAVWAVAPVLIDGTVASANTANPKALLQRTRTTTALFQLKIRKLEAYATKTSDILGFAEGDWQNSFFWVDGIAEVV